MWPSSERAGPSTCISMLVPCWYPSAGAPRSWSPRLVVAWSGLRLVAPSGGRGGCLAADATRAKPSQTVRSCPSPPCSPHASVTAKEAEMLPGPGQVLWVWVKCGFLEIAPDCDAKVLLSSKRKLYFFKVLRHLT